MLAGLECSGKQGEGKRVEKTWSFLCNFREGYPRIKEITPTDLRRTIYFKPILRIPLAFL